MEGLKKKIFHERSTATNKNVDIFVFFMFGKTILEDLYFVMKGSSMNMFKLKMLPLNRATAKN
jgi:hypothetical protein